MATKAANSEASVKLLQTVILAGGLGTRLKPVSGNLPKALMDIHGEPFIARQLRLLAQAGAEQILLCLGYRAEMIRDFVGSGAQFGLHVEYVSDGETLRGTAGAIRNALPYLEESFFVLYGDSYLRCDYAAVQRAFLSSGKRGLMTVFRNEGLWDTSNIEFADGRIIAYDKVNRTPRMHHIDYGLGVLHRSVFEELPPTGAFDLSTVYQQLLRGGELAAVLIPDRFYEIGSPGGIEELRNLLR